jgi:SNF2 family DNA or RNA helicase
MIYQPKRQPWPHQARALEHLEGKDAFALFLAMRTGKTKVVLDDFGRLELAGEAKDLLVVAPAGVYRTWETAAQDHLSEDLLDRVRIFTWDSSSFAGESCSSRQNTRDMSEFISDRSRPRIFLMNVEALSTVRKAQDAAVEFLAARRGYAAMDESTILKNIKAKRTAFIIQQLAPLARFRRIMSGLPDPNSPLDLFSQFYFLDPNILGVRSFEAFRGRYAVTQRMRVAGKKGSNKSHIIRVVVGYRNLDHLNSLIEPHKFRVRLKDCYDVPDKIYQLREVELTAEQRRLYAEMKRRALAELSDAAIVTADMVMTQILRLHQILCGHVPDTEGTMHQVPELRTKALLDLLEDYDGKAIIWCSYDEDIRKVAAAIEEKFGEGSAAKFWGGNRSAREDEEKQFLNSSSCRFMVATPASGGRGRTWTSADLIVYYSNTPDLEHRSQSEERASAIDRAAPVAVVDLAAPGTVDVKILASLRKKIKLSAVVMGEEPEKWLEA